MEFALQYYPVEAHFEGSKIYVSGTFSNGSGIYDIVSIEDAEIVICDKNGDEQGRARVNDSFAQNCIISPYGSVSYNFSCDLAGSTISSVWDARYYVEGSYQYAECAGSNCPYCGGYPGPVLDIAIDSSDISGVICPWCNGSTVCKECNGTGENNAESAVLSAWGCTLCDRTGVCTKCNGKGFI